MDRFMVHLKNLRYLPSDAPMLLTKADKLTSGMNRIIRDMRVSSKYLEFDVSVNKEQLDVIVEKLESLGPLDHARHIIEEKMEKEEAILQAKEYFNNERFWECHEVLEGVWKNTHQGEKELVQGMILVAAALVHYQNRDFYDFISFIAVFITSAPANNPILPFLACSSVNLVVPSFLTEFPDTSTGTGSSLWPLFMHGVE